MKKIRFIILVAIFLISSLSYSQQGAYELTPCYFDQLMKIKKNDPSQYKKIIEADAKIEDGVQNLLSGNKKTAPLQLPPKGGEHQHTGTPAHHHQPRIFGKRKEGWGGMGDIKTIPVVVHIIHNGGSENISEAQVQSQIDVLNEDYGKFPGTNGDGNGVDTRVRYRLAKISPDGNCTNGIVRIKSTLTDHKSFERAFLKELSFWDNTRYLNIYVMRSINGGVLGYSSYPGGPPDADGIVVIHNVFGRTGTASSSLGRTTTHELGHWFGLYHTFQGGCGTDTCTTGDFICDTPPAAGPNYGCPTGVNSCSNDNPDLPDQIENYMDYSDDACSNMLTNGQKLRIQATLNTIRTVIWTESNLVATGCDTNYIAPPTCPIVADFITLTPEICVGNSIYFMDKSLNDVTEWLWLFPGGTPDSSTLQNPTIAYNTTGIYSVTLIASDSSSSDNLIFTDYISVADPGIGDPLPFLENFESGIFPSQGITINNPDGGITWELDSLASTSGKYSIRINNLVNTNYGSADEIVLPFFDITTDTNGFLVFLNFKWAYARSDPNFSDELIVLASKDCGQSFQVLYNPNNFATGPTQTTPFIPDSSQWDSVSLFLGNYKDEPYVLLKIVNVTDGGNNLYIDDISLGDLSLLPPPSAVDDMQRDLIINIYPNPASNYLYIQPAATQTNLSGYEVTEPMNIVLRNLLGQEIINSDIRIGAGYKNNRGNPVKIDISKIPDGLYLLGINNSIYKKVLISH